MTGKGYKVDDWNKTHTEGPAPSEDVYTFYLPTTDNNWSSEKEGYASVFIVNVYPEKVYNNLSDAGQVTTERTLGSNVGYTFTYSNWQDAP